LIAWRGGDSISASCISTEVYVKENSIGEGYGVLFVHRIATWEE